MAIVFQEASDSELREWSQQRLDLARVTRIILFEKFF